MNHAPVNQKRPQSNERIEGVFNFEPDGGILNATRSCRRTLADNRCAKNGAVAQLVRAGDS